MAGQLAHPTPAHAMAASASVGYEIPARLRTLHNLVSNHCIIINLHFYLGKLSVTGA